MRVLILFCEEGEGHASAARVLERDLTERGAEVVVVDAMQRGLGRFVPLVSRDAYHVQVRRLRWSYGLEYFLFTRVPPVPWMGRRGLCTFASRLLRNARAGDVLLLHDADWSSAPGSWRRTAAALELVLERLRDRGLRVASL